MTPTYELETALDPAACVERLKPEVNRWIRGPFAPDRPLSGWVTARGFMLCPTIGYRNSFQTYARGRFERVGARTRVAVTMGMHPFVWAFGALWVGSAAYGAVDVVLHPAAGAFWPTLAAPVGMSAFFLAMVAFGRWLARGDEAVLVEALGRLLEARVRRTSP